MAAEAPWEDLDLDNVGEAEKRRVIQLVVDVEGVPVGARDYATGEHFRLVQDHLLEDAPANSRKWMLVGGPHVSALEVEEAVGARADSKLELAIAHTGARGPRPGERYPAPVSYLLNTDAMMGDEAFPLSMSYGGGWALARIVATGDQGLALSEAFFNGKRAHELRKLPEMPDPGVLSDPEDILRLEQLAGKWSDNDPFLQPYFQHDTWEPALGDTNAIIAFRIDDSAAPAEDRADEPVFYLGVRYALPAPVRDQLLAAARTSGKTFGEWANSTPVKRAEQMATHARDSLLRRAAHSIGVQVRGETLHFPKDVLRTEVTNPDGEGDYVAYHAGATHIAETPGALIECGHAELRWYLSPPGGRPGGAGWRAHLTCSGAPAHAPPADVEGDLAFEAARAAGWRPEWGYLVAKPVTVL